MKQTYKVKGMHCSSCSTIISKKLQKLEGIQACEVNFATEKAAITYDPKKINPEIINNEINKYGYSMIAPNEHTEHLGLHQTKDEKIDELYKLKNKVAFGLPITLFIFFLMMWEIGAKIFSFTPNLPIPMQLFQTISFLLATIVLFWIGKPYLDAVVRFIKYRVANMDALVGIGTITAYLYSSILFLFPPIREQFQLPDYMYFDITIVVIGFITLGKYLETKSKYKTGDAIEKLLHLQAKTALIFDGGKEREVPLADVKVGDILIVKPGMKIPVDGIITEGTTSVDQSMITGEAFPIPKKRGDTVIGATINKQGSFYYQAKKVGSETMLSQIISLVETSQNSKTQIQNLADRVSSLFIPAVLLIAVFSFLIWIIVGTFQLGFSSALSYGLLAFVGILVIACPCALGLAVPTAVIVGVGKGAEKGILIKNAESLEKLYKVDTLVIDKTGTLTSGKPVVAAIQSLDGVYKDKDILQYALSLEKNSQHPLADAIIEKATKLNIQSLKVEKFQEIEGYGVKGIIGKKKITLQKPNAYEEKLDQVVQFASKGMTVVVLHVANTPVGIIGISDSLKENAVQIIQKLQSMNIHIVMLTGDNQKAAEAVASQLGIDDIKANVLPQDKSKIIQDLQQEGKYVAMVGDGINDAPALSQANVGIAMATGSDIAIESSDITLLGGNIARLSEAIKLSHLTIRTIKQNLFWAFIYNIIGIPLAAGVFFPYFGIFLNPVFAGLAMAVSSVSVVSNSLLLKKYKL